MQVDNDLVEIIKSELQHNGGISLLTLRKIDQNHLVETINQISQDLSIGEGTNLEYKLSDANLDELWDKLKKKKQVIFDLASNKRSNLQYNNTSPEPNAKKSKVFNNFSTPISKSQQISEKVTSIMQKTNRAWNKDYVYKVLNQNNNDEHETIVQLDVEKIIKRTGMSYEEAKQLYFDSNSDPDTAINNYEEIKRQQQQIQEDNNNDNDNNNNNDNDNDNWLAELGL
tara:strand:+ start:29 stop:709 length:681 start_codon:yes stop_codon:yes gene_type:complete